MALDTRGRPIANALVWIRPALHSGLVTEVRLFSRLDELLRDDVFELELTPQGPLADGSESQVHTRSIRVDAGSIFQDIPLGVYTVEATWVHDGVRTPLKVNRDGSDEWGSTTTLDWQPVGCSGSTAPSMRSFLYISR